MKIRPGFTLIELILIMGLLATLVTLASVNLLSSQHQTSLNSTLTTLITDIKSQQLKAMSGDTEGRGITDNYGVYFAATEYVLFHGSVYISGDPTNSVIPLDNSLQFSSTLPASSLIFAKGSGDIIGFTIGSDSVTLASPSNSKTIHLNKYGVVTSQN